MCLSVFLFSFFSSFFHDGIAFICNCNCATHTPYKRTSNTFGRSLAHRIEVLFEEDRVIELNGTSFTDDLEPFDVHVYRLVPVQQ